MRSHEGDITNLQEVGRAVEVKECFCVMPESLTLQSIATAVENEDSKAHRETHEHNASASSSMDMIYPESSSEEKKEDIQVNDIRISGFGKTNEGVSAPCDNSIYLAEPTIHQLLLSISNNQEKMQQKIVDMEKSMQKKVNYASNNDANDTMIKLERQLDLIGTRLKNIEFKLDNSSNHDESGDVKAADRKRLKSRMKEYMELELRSRKQSKIDSHLWKSYNTWLEYIFGICSPDPRTGRTGSRLIHPTSRFMIGLVMFSFVCLAYTAAMAPVQIEVVIQFFVAVHDKNGFYNDSMAYVSYHYLTNIGNFWFDLVTSVPFSYIDLAMYAGCGHEGEDEISTVGNARTLRAVKILRIFKLVRLLKFAKFCIVIADYAIYYLGITSYKVIRLLTVALTVVHLFACLYWKVKVEAANVPEDVNLFLESKSVAPDDFAQIYVRIKPSEFSCFLFNVFSEFYEWQLLSFYFVFTVFTTVGFGMPSFCSYFRRICLMMQFQAISTPSHQESGYDMLSNMLRCSLTVFRQVYCIFLFLAGASLFATLISQLNEIFHGMAKATAELDEKLGLYLTVEPRLGLSELRKIFGWIKFQVSASQVDRQHREIIDRASLPHNLRREVARKVENSLFSKILFLKATNSIQDILSLFCAELFLKSKQLYFPEGQVIADSRDDADGLMVVTYGSVSVEVPMDSDAADVENDKARNVLRVLIKGDVLGDNVMVGDRRWGGSMGIRADFIAKTNCAIAHIKKEDIMEILKKFEFFPIACKIQLAELNSRLDLKHWNGQHMSEWESGSLENSKHGNQSLDAGSSSELYVGTPCSPCTGRLGSTTSNRTKLHHHIKLGPKETFFWIQMTRYVANAYKESSTGPEEHGDAHDGNCRRDLRARLLNTCCKLFNPDVKFKLVTQDELKFAEQALAAESTLLKDGIAALFIGRICPSNSDAISFTEFERIVEYLASKQYKVLVASKSQNTFILEHVGHESARKRDEHHEQNNLNSDMREPSSSHQCSGHGKHKLVRELYDSFAKDDSGSMLNHELKRFLEHFELVRLLHPTLTNEQKEQIRTTCFILDEDGDGKLSKEEYVDALEVLGITFSDQSIEGISVDVAEKLRLGKLMSFEDVELFVRHLGFTEQICPRLTEGHRKDVREAFELFDTDGNETLHMNELKAALFSLGFEPSRVDASVTQLLRMFDSDNSQELDFEEFEEFMRSIALTNGGVMVLAKHVFNYIRMLWQRESRNQSTESEYEFSGMAPTITKEMLSHICKKANLSVSEEEIECMLSPFHQHTVTCLDLYKIMRNTCWY